VFYINITKIDQVCCNGCTLILQMSVFNVSSIFSDVCCKFVYLVLYMFHTYVANVLCGCCVCLQ
jgi:hypothetical protein